MSSSQVTGQSQDMTANTATAQQHSQNAAYDNFEVSSPGTKSNNFHDSGFFEDAESYHHTSDYKDWILFPLDTPWLPTDNFFPDLDDSTIANHGSAYNGENNERASITIAGEVPASANTKQCTSLWDPVHAAALEAVNNYDSLSLSQSKPTVCSPRPQSILTPLEKWACTIERHELVAYRFEHPPQSARTQTVEIRQQQSLQRAHTQ